MKRSIIKMENSITRTIYGVALGLFIGWCFFGCGKSTVESSTPVPSDCQDFLVKYFEAVKSKDVLTIQNVSWCVSSEECKGMPEASVEKTRETKKKMVADSFRQMTEKFGDLKSYSVLNVKVTTISPEDQPAANMMGVGIHAEIVCKAKFSKYSAVRIGLHLFKETQDSEYFLLSWNYQAGP
jgi:hypothetical protein